MPDQATDSFCRKLNQNGVKAVFDQAGSRLLLGNQLFPLVRFRNLFYLPVRLREPSALGPGCGQREERSLRKVAEESEEVQVTCDMTPRRKTQQFVRRMQKVPEKEKPVLVEWCCDDDSKMSAIWMEGGAAAMRLGLPDYNLASKVGVGKALSRMREALRRGKKIVVWISLPCAPWSPWQFIGTSKNPYRIVEGKRHSLSMLRLVLNAVEALKQEYPKKVQATLEWPKNCGGWCTTEGRRAATMLPDGCLLDGCQYSLIGRNGNPVKKSWRVQTDIPGLRETLNYQCRGGHQHDECPGEVAEQAGRYTA